VFLSFCDRYYPESGPSFSPRVIMRYCFVKSILANDHAPCVFLHGEPWQILEFPSAASLLRLCVFLLPFFLLFRTRRDPWIFLSPRMGAVLFPRVQRATYVRARLEDLRTPTFLRTHLRSLLNLNFFMPPLTIFPGHSRVPSLSLPLS